MWLKIEKNGNSFKFFKAKMINQSINEEEEKNEAKIFPIYLYPNYNLAA
jgi:hypothetical protein